MLTLGRRPMLVALALLPALLAEACTSSNTAATQLPSTVTIGLLVPKTGTSAPVGLDAIRGAELAIDLINNPYPDVPLPLGATTGLHNGVKLVLTVGDTQGAPEKVEDQASRLVNGGAIGLVLADDISVAKSAGRQVDIMGVAMIDALSTADLFADLNRSGHFRIQPTDRIAVRATMALLFREHAIGKPIDKIAVVGPATSLSFNEEAETIKKEISDLGQAEGYASGPVLSLGPGGSSASDLASAVTNSKSSVVLAIVTSPPEAAAAVDLAVKLKGSVPVVALGPGTSGLDIAKIGQTDMFRTAGWSAEYTRRNPVAVQVSQLYERRYSAKLSDVAASAFTATLTLALAMDNAKGLTAGDVRGAVQQLAMPATQTIMPWDGIRFDGNGNNQLAASVVEQRSANGFQVINPVELAATQLTWP